MSNFSEILKGRELFTISCRQQGKARSRATRSEPQAGGQDDNKDEAFALYETPGKLQASEWAGQLVCTSSQELRIQ